MTATRQHDGRVAIVTGTNVGLGVEIARMLAENGAKLVLGDIAGSNLSGYIQDWEADYGIGGTQFVGDLSREEGAKALVAHAMQTFGRVDILVNNAGGGLIRPFLSHTVETLEETLRRNLWTVLLCTTCRIAAYGGGQIWPHRQCRRRIGEERIAFPCRLQRGEGRC